MSLYLKTRASGPENKWGHDFFPRPIVCWDCSTITYDNGQHKTKYKNNAGKYDVTSIYSLNKVRCENLPYIYTRFV